MGNKKINHISNSIEFNSNNKIVRTSPRYSTQLALVMRTDDPKKQFVSCCVREEERKNVFYDVLYCICYKVSK